MNLKKICIDLYRFCACLFIPLISFLQFEIVNFANTSLITFFGLGMHFFIFRESEFDERWEEVSESIESNGLYDLSLDEISFGARTAWRNVARSQ